MIVTPAAVTTDRNPVPLDHVTSDEAGWLGRLQRRNAIATIPHVIRQLEDSRTLWNLRRAAERGGAPDAGRRGAFVDVHDQERAASSGGGHVGYQFSDSDLHKTLEAVGWEIGRTGTTAFDDFLDEAVALLRAAQEPDGYLNSWGSNPASPARWSDLAWGHELYTGGHLLQAAVALSRAGRPDLLPIGRRWADLVVERFGPGRSGYCGHPEVETALIELGRETGDTAYLDTARALLDRRGSGDFAGASFGRPYLQDHQGVREAREATGHAVRQLYLDAGCADLLLAEVGTGTVDDALRSALVARWESAHHQKMYLTGALGSRHRDESFGAPYELPPDLAYAETCAAIADVMVSWRLLLATGESRYAEAIERVLHNALPAALSSDGCAFFYSDPLQLRTGTTGAPSAPVRRTPWYACACCPPNIARLIASLGGYVATLSGTTVDLHQYVACRIDLPAPVGGSLVVDTDVPRSGRLALTFHPAAGAEADSMLTVALRWPGWAATAPPSGSGPVSGKGYVDLQLTPGRTLELDLGVRSRVVVAHPRVDAVRGCVAVVRGPVVHCVEQADLTGTGLDLESLVFEPHVDERTSDDGTPRPVVRAWRPEPAADLYSEPAAPAPRTGPWDVTLQPYAEWGNRSPGAMRVWLPIEGGVTPW